MMKKKKTMKKTPQQPLRSGLVTEKESDFGEGFIYCLALFGMHFGDVREFLHTYRMMRQDKKRVAPKGMFSDARALKLWASGASDHLIDMKIPQYLSETLKRKLRYIQHTMLEYGHGIEHLSMPVRVFEKVRRTYLEVTKEVDRVFDVRVKEATWK